MSINGGLLGITSWDINKRRMQWTISAMLCFPRCAACDDYIDHYGSVVSCPRPRDPELLHKLSMGALTAESLPQATAVVGGGMVQDIVKFGGPKEWDGLQLGFNDGFG